MINKGNILALSLLAVLLISGCALTTNTKHGDEPVRAVVDNELKSVTIDDYCLTVTASENFEYSFSKTPDPFKVLIELKGVRQGAFAERIISKKEGISEVAFVEKTLPVKDVSCCAERYRASA
ncbi:MAG: hypothetical protein L7F77_10535 [Candidatus Magnetominusculus sp. LBB02]|nr:hypothetical protein [Candidatus Magnetominusculus sp. LBB02]